MLRRQEITTDNKVQAWLSFIEQNLLLSDVIPSIVRIERVIPVDLIDLVDNELKMDGWRLRRPVARDGQLLSPIQHGRPSHLHERAISYFEVEADAPCSPHDWNMSWPDPKRFCRYCGEFSTETDIDY